MDDGAIHADVAELVDALDLGSSVLRRKSSSLFIRIASIPLGWETFNLRSRPETSYY